MPERLTDALVRKLKPPCLVRDTVVRGLAVRVSSDTARTFVLCRGRGRIRLGHFPTLSVADARSIARERLSTASGLRPSARPTTETIASLCARYEREYLPLKAVRSQYEDARLLKTVIGPMLGSNAVGTLTRQDVQSWHSLVTRTRGHVRANRALATLSKILNLYCDSNVCRHVRKNREHRRERFFTDDELARINTALDSYCDQDAADLVRLIMFTGCRPCEAMRATPSEFVADVWKRPGVHMKARRASSVPLSHEALAVIRRRLASCKEGRVFATSDLRYVWRHVKKHAKIDAPPYTLRHTFASRLVARGASLPVVARLLAHSSTQTTMRYAHVDDLALRDAVAKLMK